MFAFFAKISFFFLSFSADVTSGLDAAFEAVGADDGSSFLK